MRPCVCAVAFACNYVMWAYAWIEKCDCACAESAHFTFVCINIKFEKKNSVRKKSSEYHSVNRVHTYTHTHTKYIVDVDIVCGFGFFYIFITFVVVVVVVSDAKSLA